MQFKFYIPLKKDLGSDQILEGVASAISIDKDGERMSEFALDNMIKDIKSLGVNLFGNHQHDWENTLGVIKDAWKVDKKLYVKIALDDPTTNSKIPMLLNKLKRDIKLGLSVGGDVLKEKFEYDKSRGKQVRIIDSVKLYEISVVGIPSNNDAYVAIPTQIAKCYSESLNNNICKVCLSKMTGKSCGVCLWKN